MMKEPLPAPTKESKLSVVRSTAIAFAEDASASAATAPRESLEVNMTCNVCACVR